MGSSSCIFLHKKNPKLLQLFHWLCTFGEKNPGRQIQEWKVFYLVWPSESLHTGSMATGLMAHSRMARAKANSLALLHIWTALIQLVLQNSRRP